ncbi:hypothetical protein BsWGS_02554 [Bradybaena similaris]
MRPRTSHSLRGPACSLCDIIQYGYFHQVSLLVSKGMDVNVRDSLGRTPLILCAFMQPPDWGVGTARTLIEHGVYLGERDCFGRNVLHYACIYERQNLVEVLLRAIDFDLNQADALGNTALHYAAMSGNVSITNLLVQSCRKYCVKPNKANRQGKTALQLARTSGCAACARVIDLELSPDQQGNAIKDVHFTVNVGLDSPADDLTSQSVPALGKSKFRRATSAAILSRLKSSSSLSYARPGRSLLSSVSRSCSNLRSGYPRKSSRPLYANGFRRDEEIIYCAPNGDFRNTPEYVCKLVRLPRETTCWNHVTAVDLANSSRDWEGTTCQSAQNGAGWRPELQQLFKVYEHQCSASWRTSKQWEQPAAAAPTSLAGSEDKARKGRPVTSISRPAHGKDISPEPRKRAPSVRSRRMLNGKHAGGATADVSLDTSSESINSLVSVRRTGLEAETSLGRSAPSL